MSAEREALAGWTALLPGNDLPPGAARAISLGGGRRVAVFRLTDGSIHAVGDRCPHEGYPLSKGLVREGDGGAVLTCCWHEFRFELADGRCLQGDEDVRVFPARERDGSIEIDVTEPDPQAVRATALESLEGGLLEARVAQAARDAVRALQAGGRPIDLAVAVARFDASRGEYGLSHALATAVDGLPLATRREGLRAVEALVPALEMAAESQVRRPLREDPDPSPTLGEVAAARQQFAELIEAREGTEAVALLRGALRAGVDREEVTGWTWDACARHFLAFGHCLIYQGKILDLLDAAGWKHADALLSAHVWGIAHATRDDTLPEQRWLAERLDAAERDEIPPPGREPASEELFEAIVDGRREDAFDSVASALAGGTPENVVADAITAAAGERLLRFDITVDARHDVQEGWLDVTHALTHAEAARRAARERGGPTGRRALLLAAWFANRGRPLDATDATEPMGVPEASIERFVDAVERRDASDAVSHAAGLLRSAEGTQALAVAATELALDPTRVRPIIVAHLLKTTTAAFAERQRMRAPALADKPVLGAVRFLASPVRETSRRRVVHEAIRLLADGKVPRRLT